MQIPASSETEAIIDIVNNFPLLIIGWDFTTREESMIAVISGEVISIDAPMSSLSWEQWQVSDRWPRFGRGVQKLDENNFSRELLFSE